MRGNIIGIVCAMMSIACSQAVAAEKYYAQSIGPWIPVDLNNAGDVLFQDGRIYSKGLFEKLRLPGSYVRASSMNDFWQVVAYSTSSVGGYLYSNGRWESIGDLSGGLINNAGQIVGQTQNGLAVLRGTDGNEYRFDAFGSYTRPLSINELGAIAGTAYQKPSSLVEFKQDPFVFAGGSASNLGNLGHVAYATDINDAGQIVGYSVPSWAPNPSSGLYWHATLYSQGVLYDLGTMWGTSSLAFAINNRSQIVGQYMISLAEQEYRAFIYEGGVASKLSDLVVNQGPSFYLKTAIDINERGQILATGSGGAYLLTPVSMVPEPSTYALMLAGLAAVTGVARARWRASR